MWALVPSLRFVLLYSSVFTPVFSSRTLLSTLGTAVLIAVGIDDTCCWELPLWEVTFRISFFTCCSHWAIAMRSSSILVLHCHCMSRVGAVSGEERMWTCLLVQCRTVSPSGPWLWSLLTFAPSTVIVTTVVPGRGDMHFRLGGAVALSKILEMHRAGAFRLGSWNEN